MWRNAGWRTRVLTLKDAKLSPLYEDMWALLSKLKLGPSALYEKMCFVRYLAMASVGGGWMSDIDVLPTFLDPDGPLPNNGNFTLYQENVPALISAKTEEWEGIASKMMQAMQNPAYRIPKNDGVELYSDMYALQDMNAAYISLGMVPLANEWAGPSFTDCRILRGPTLAVHFSHGSIESMGIDRLADRGALMALAREKFLKCQM